MLLISEAYVMTLRGNVRYVRYCIVPHLIEVFRIESTLRYLPMYRYMYIAFPRWPVQKVEPQFWLYPTAWDTTDVSLETLLPLTYL